MKLNRIHQRLYILLIITMIFYCLGQTTMKVSGQSYGFDYKFITGISGSRDPGIYTPQAKEIKGIKAKNPSINVGKLKAEDISVNNNAFNTDYSTKTDLSTSTQKILQQVPKITGTEFEKSLQNWNICTDVFEYAIQKTQSNQEYLQILVKDFSMGIDLADLFDCTDMDLLELNTQQEHGYDIQLLNRENLLSIALIPKVEQPGKIEFLLADSIIVVIKPIEKVQPLSISSEALSGSIKNILSQSEVNSSDAILPLPGDLDELLNKNTPEQQTVTNNNNNNVNNNVNNNNKVINNSPQNEIPIQEPSVFVNQEFGADNYVDSGSSSSSSNSGNFFSTLGELESNNNEILGSYNMNSNYDLNTQPGIEVVYNGEKKVLKEIPDGYYTELNEKGENVLKKRQLDISGINFGRSWGIVNKIDGDEALKYINLDTTGNDLLKGVETEMLVNIDTLTGHDVRTFYEKPLPERYHPLDRSDRIVIIHGKYNWAIAIVLGVVSVILAMVYFIVLSRYINNRLKELKKNYLIRDSEIVPEIDAVDVQSMQL